ncbi:MAG: hypothetical protein KDA91_21740 [Planctomycetaceae bacterium]|nr:hypothetical protein [Planctomycetaceae bacterium]
MAENLTLLILAVAPFLLLRIAADLVPFRRGKIRPASFRNLLLGNFVVFMFLSSIVLFSGEIYYRFFVDTTDSFSLSKVSARWFSRHFVRNMAGFRDSVHYLPETTPGQRRVSFLGDSFTAGQGITDVDQRFANLLRKMRPGDEVHVLADCGWDTQKELDLVRFLPQSGYQTDVVVLVYCLNDVSDLMDTWQEELARVYQARPGLIVSSSYLLDTLRSRWVMWQHPKLQKYYQSVTGIYTAESEEWRRQQRRLDGIREAVEDSGGRLLVVTFPFVHCLGNYEFQNAHDLVGEYWKDSGVDHLDLLPVFQSEWEKNPTAEWTVNSRDAHPGIYAHQVAAREIDAFLTKHFRETESD